MAGNVGVQSSAIIVQGIANQVIKGSLINRLFKEIGLGLINGLILSIVLIIFGEIINQDILLSLTVAGSMMSVIILSALIGTFVPIILHRQGFDPAIATGPFITTANDIFGILTGSSFKGLDNIFSLINNEKKGAVLFINQEQNSNDLLLQLKELKKMQNDGELNKAPRIKMDIRDYGIGAQILHDLRISKLKVISNTSQKRRVGITGYGLEIVDYIKY